MSCLREIGKIGLKMKKMGSKNQKEIFYLKSDKPLKAYSSLKIG